MPPDVAHVTRAVLEELGGVREALPESPLVLDLTGEGDTALTPLQARQAQLANAVLAGSRWELGELGRLDGLPARVAVVQRPLDLDWHAPEDQLAEAKGRGRDLRRFRRFHRLAGPVVLFAGPYTEAAVSTCYSRQSSGFVSECPISAWPRSRMARLTLATATAARCGPLDSDTTASSSGTLPTPRFHSGTPSWQPSVCRRVKRRCRATKRAAAAARPFIGTDLEPFREHVDDRTTGHLVPVGDLESLQATLDSVLGAEGEATRLGDAALRRAKTDYSPAAAAQGLRRE